MTEYIVFFVLIGFLFYFGQIVGLFWLCNNSRYLKKAKKYVCFVPLFNIILFFMLLIDSFKKREIKTLLFYLFMEEKSAFILGSFALEEEVVVKEKSTKRKKRNKNISILDVIRSVKDDLPIAAVV